MVRIQRQPDALLKASLLLARTVIGCLVGGVVGVLIAFSLAITIFLFGDCEPRAVWRERLFDECPVYFTIVAAAVGSVGGAFWGWAARALLHFCVFAMVGGYAAAIASFCCLSQILIIRDGDLTSFISESFVMVGAMAGGVFGVYHAFWGEDELPVHESECKEQDV